MIVALFMLAQASVWDQFDPKPAPPIEQTAPKPNPNAPALLVIATQNAVKTIPYKTMRACWAAARAGNGPVGTRAPDGALMGPGIAQFSCIPRN